ncbi:TRAP transporter substrate-binding protein [Roseobacter sinensis]|uniref:TRAP transporter substrate-binding protein n=1 Tax=Roseobacter sinensis TaxID=2931391 RepID=A0ABT3BIQ5_9RHOB|nr:TRAP transporter substrate-binding protein [Roseobacter sp. WL0113]MCV3273457.1 TRAP transporter substrate-binding protein [Roseobacter sp. WL0113]
MKTTILASALAVAALPALAETEIRATGLVSTHKFHTALEQEFYAGLSEKTGIPLAINFNPLDVVGVDMQDTLRMVRTGAFDIVQSTVGAAARDDAFLEGIDLIGVSTDMDQLAAVVEAFRPELEKRVAEKFNAKPLAVWPYGPQVFYCNAEIASLDDFEGLKIRSYTASMSTLIEALGASPVTMSFKEVYPALQRGVVDCAITSPTSGNTGNWPEVTTHFLPLGISWSVNAHFINLDTWNSFSDDQKATLEAEFAAFEDAFWDLARENNGWAIACNTGGEDCQNYTPFDMTLVEASAEDQAKVTAATMEKVLPDWAESCDAGFADCTKIWNATAGAARGIELN